VSFVETSISYPDKGKDAFPFDHVILGHYLSYLVSIFDDNDCVPDSYRPLDLIPPVPDCGFPKRNLFRRNHLTSEEAVKKTQREILWKIQKTLGIILNDDDKKKKTPHPEFSVILKKKNNPVNGKAEYE
jgi:hypothetical protein